MGARQKRLSARNLFGQTKLMESPAQRELMASTLALSGDPRMRDLGIRCMASAYKQHSFAAVMDELSLTWGQVEAEVRSIRKSEGYIRASQHLPDLMEQVAIDAKSRTESCTACHGTGVVRRDKKTEICSSCHGLKEIYVPGEVERQKLVFETFGLIGKNGGPLVHLDLRRTDQSEGLEELSQSVAGILDGSGKME